MGRTYPGDVTSRSIGFLSTPTPSIQVGTDRGIGYLAAVTPALEDALASAHEAGHERAVRILHAVIAILDDPGLR